MPADGATQHGASPAGISPLAASLSHASSSSQSEDQTETTTEATDVTSHLSSCSDSAGDQALACTKLANDSGVQDRKQPRPRRHRRKRRSTGVGAAANDRSPQASVSARSRRIGFATQVDIISGLTESSQSIAVLEDGGIADAGAGAGAGTGETSKATRTKQGPRVAGAAVAEVGDTERRRQAERVGAIQRLMRVLIVLGMLAIVLVFGFVNLAAFVSLADTVRVLGTAGTQVSHAAHVRAWAMLQLYPSDSSLGALRRPWAGVPSSVYNASESVRLASLEGAVAALQSGLAWLQKQSAFTRSDSRRQLLARRGCLREHATDCRLPSDPWFDVTSGGLDGLVQAYTDAARSWARLSPAAVGGDVTLIDLRGPLALIDSVAGRELRDGLVHACRVLASDARGAPYLTPTLVMLAQLAAYFCIFILLLRPMLRSINAESKRTQVMLSIIPASVAVQVPAIAAYFGDDDSDS